MFAVCHHKGVWVSCVLGGMCGRHLTWAVLAVLKANVVPTRKGDPINKARSIHSIWMRLSRARVRTGFPISETIWSSLENPLWETHRYEPIREPAFVFLPSSVTTRKATNTNRGRAASLSGQEEYHILDFFSLFLAPTQEDLIPEEWRGRDAWDLNHIHHHSPSPHHTPSQETLWESGTQVLECFWLLHH